jgi:hypothetical protein
MSFSGIRPACSMIWRTKFAVVRPIVGRAEGPEGDRVDALGQVGPQLHELAAVIEVEADRELVI